MWPPFFPLSFTNFLRTLVILLITVWIFAYAWAWLYDQFQLVK